MMCEVDGHVDRHSPRTQVDRLLRRRLSLPLRPSRFLFILTSITYRRTDTMPIALSPSEALPLPKWQRPAKTIHDLPWADIKVLDLSTFDLPGGKQKLADELRDAVCVQKPRTYLRSTSERSVSKQAAHS